MNRENHPRAQALLRQRRVELDHRALENVGRGPLNRHVDRFALGLRAHLEITARQIRHQPSSAEHRLDHARAPRLLEHLIDEDAHARKPLEVRVDEFLRRFLRDVDVLR